MIKTRVFLRPLVFGLLSLSLGNCTCRTQPPDESSSSSSSGGTEGSSSSAAASGGSGTSGSRSSSRSGSSSQAGTSSATSGGAGSSSGGATSAATSGAEASSSTEASSGTGASGSSGTHVNVAPVITGQGTLTILEDTSRVLLLTDLVVVDADNTFPADFVLAVDAGNHYTLNGAELTPERDFSGALSVPVTVNDGTDTSNTFLLQVTVTPVNDPPVVVAQQALTALSGGTLEVTLGDVTIVDVDSAYPGAFRLLALGGNHYTAADTATGFTLSVEAGFVGTLEVPLTAFDGVESGPAFSLQVSVVSMGVVPVITGQAPVSTAEDTPVTVTLADLVVTGASSPSSVVKVLAGAHYTVAGTQVVPEANFNGVLHVAVRVFNGVLDSAVFDLNITVTPVNDPPTVAAGAPLQTDEDTALNITLADVTVADVDNTAGDFTLTIQPGSHYTVDGSGAVLPDADYFGPLAVNVTVSDGNASSAGAQVAVEVLPVNDAPIVIGQTGVGAIPGTPRTLALVDLTVQDVDNTYPMGFTLSILDGAGYTHAGNTFTLDAGVTSSVVVLVRVNDGAADSATYMLHVTVLSGPNVAPVISGQVPLTTTEDTALLLSLADFTVTDPDTAPASLTLVASAGPHHTVVNGTVVPEANFNGVLDVVVVVNDGVDNSAPFTAHITVTPAADPPVVVSIPARTVAEDTAFSVAISDVNVTDADTPASGLTLTVLDGDHYTHVGNTVTPAQDYNGALAVNLQVTDGDTPPVAGALAVTVTPVNDPAVITADAVPDVSEDTSIPLALGLFSVTDPDGPAAVLVIGAGPNHTVVGDTVVPNANFTGALVIPVSVFDGVDPGVTYTLVVDVTPVNDPPVIIGQGAVATLEDTPLTVNLTDLLVTDPDNTYPNGFTLTVEPGLHYTVSGNVITPEQDYSGTLVAAVRVNDGTSDSADYLMGVVVTAVNDAPVVTGQGSLQVQEDATLTLSIADFVVTDVDGPPAQLVDVLPGAHHTVSGTTVIPDANYSGTLQVTIRVTDGTALSADFVATVVVNPVNDLPSITGQLPMPFTATEDVAFTPTLANLAVSDVDHTYPAGFTLVVEPGANYSTNGVTVTPAPDFNGSLAVTVHVVDPSGGASLPFPFTASVAAVNDLPVITGQNPTPLTLVEDTPFVLALSNLQVTDVDNAFPAGFTLQVDPGANHSVAGSTITPAANFSGSLTVGVRVVDPDGGVSNTFSVVAQVGAQNDAPVITAQVPSPVVTAEDTAFTLSLSGFQVTDVDNPYPTGFTLVASAGANYTLGSVTATSVLVTPAANFNGTLSVPVLVRDPGGVDSNTWVAQVSVTSVNDLPVITAQVPSPFTTNEDTTLALLPAMFTVTDVDHPGYPTGFTLQVGSGANYVVTGTQVTPAPNFNGTLTVPVTVTDPAGGVSLAFNASINVASVNDLPIITAQLPALLAATEDTAFAVLPTMLVVTDADNPGYPAGFTIQVGAGSNYSVAGTTVTPSSNYNGPLTIPVTVTDPAGGVSNSFALQVNVAAVNDLPVIAAQVPSPFTTTEDTALLLSTAGFQVTDVDNAGFPAGFTLQVLPGANYTVAGFTVTPAINFSGTLSVPVTVMDPSGGVSLPFTATIAVSAVNDAPVITAQAGAVTVAEDTTLPILLTHLVVNDVDNPGYPTGFTLQVAAGSNYSVAGSSVTPSANYNGTLSVQVTVTDQAGAVSNTFPLQVTVTPVNDPPVITASSTPASINEDTPFTVTFAQLTVNDPDSTYPNAFTLTLSSCVNCTFSGAVVTPTANYFSGAAMTVDVVVNDGAANSNVRTLSFTVTPVNDPPVGALDVYTTTGNTLKTVAAPGVLANDTDVDSTGLTVTVGNVTSTNGGTAVMAADGSFTFLPAAGFTGADSFSYTLNDPQGASSVGTVNVQVVGLVWYVQGSYVGTSTGRSTQPFTTLAQAGTTSTANSTIYVRSGNYTGSLVLKASQKLQGEGLALVLLPNNPDIPAGVRPVLSNPAGGVITTLTGNTLSGFNIGSAGGTGISGTNVATLNVADVNVANTRVGIQVAGTASVVTLDRVNINTVVNAGLATGRGLAMSNARMLFTDVWVDAAAITALEVADAPGVNTFTRLTLSNNGQDGIFWQATGASAGATATFNTLVVNGTNDPGSAVILRSDSSVTAGANVAFTFNTATIQNVRGFGDGFNVAAEGGNALLNLTIQGSTLDNTVAGAGSGGNGIRISAAAAGGTLTANLVGNTLRRWLNDTISLESGSLSTLVATLSNNVVGDAINPTVEGSVNGDGISLLMDGPTVAGVSTAQVTFINNLVRNVLGLGFNIESRGLFAGPRVKATFAGNTVDAMNRPASRPSLRVRSRESTVMCASFNGDNMQTPAGGMTGSELTQVAPSTYYRTTLPAGGVTLTGVFSNANCPF